MEFKTTYFQGSIVLRSQWPLQQSLHLRRTVYSSAFSALAAQFPDYAENLEYLTRYSCFLRDDRYLLLEYINDYTWNLELFAHNLFMYTCYSDDLPFLSFVYWPRRARGWILGLFKSITTESLLDSLICTHARHASKKIRAFLRTEAGIVDYSCCYLNLVARTKHVCSRTVL